MGHLFLKVLLSFNKTISPSVKFLFCRVTFALVVPYSTCSKIYQYRVTFVSDVGSASTLYSTCFKMY